MDTCEIDEGQIEQCANDDEDTPCFLIREEN
jgi:hypothetical protein